MVSFLQRSGWKSFIFLGLCDTACGQGNGGIRAQIVVREDDHDKKVLDNRPKISTTVNLPRTDWEARGISETTAVRLVAISGRNLSASASWMASTG